VLDTLITSKTRLRLLLKFFTNSKSSAYLRGLAEEFGESTNSIRLELNNLSNAGFLTYADNGRIVEYKANTTHPLFNEIRSIVHKYLGLDKIVEQIVHKLGKVEEAYLVGDYAKGLDSGTIQLLIVGEIDKVYLQKLISKAKGIIKRNIKAEVISEAEKEKNLEYNGHYMLLWKE
jgi:hypothetical protein